MAACSLSIGVVGTWASHWISIIAIRLGDGSTPIQLAYDPTRVGLSALVPTVVFFLCLGLLDLNFIKTWVRYFVYGLFGLTLGLATVLMHLCWYYALLDYLFPVSNGAFAALIIVSCLMGLIIMFWLFKVNSIWITSIVGRLAGSFVIAVFIAIIAYIPFFKTEFYLLGYVPASFNSTKPLTVAAIVLVSFLSQRILQLSPQTCY